jgi:hypothetical protein
MRTNYGFWVGFFLSVIISTAGLSSFGQTNGNILVSPYGFNSQFAVDRNGNAHIVWTGYSQEASSIQYSVFSSSGTQLHDSIEIAKSNYVDNPNICTGIENILISYRAVRMETNIAGIFLDYNGNFIGNVFIPQRNSGSDFGSYSCEINKGDFLLGWSADPPIRGQIFSIDSLNRNTIDLINFNVSNVNHSGPIILKSPGINKFVLVWNDDHTGERQMYTKIFNLDGTSASDIITVSTDSLIDLFYYSAAMDSSGKFTIVWSGNRDSVWQIDKRLFDPAGNPLTGCQRVNADSIKIGGYASASVSYAKNGNSIIAWECEINNYVAIYLNRYDPNGNQLGKTINFTPSQNSRYNNYECAVLKDDKIYMVWDQDNKVMLKIADFNQPDFVEDNATQNNANFYLGQNYPNPFNSETIIRYGLSDYGHVEIKLYDVLGHEVSTLVNDSKPGGLYTVRLNSGKLASGIYFYTFKSGSYMESRKLVILK